MKDTQTKVGGTPEDAGKAESQKWGIGRKILAAIFFLMFSALIVSAFLRKFAE
jgi:hypothetical protein